MVVVDVVWAKPLLDLDLAWLECLMLYLDFNLKHLEMVCLEQITLCHEEEAWVARTVWVEGINWWDLKMTSWVFLAHSSVITVSRSRNLSLSNIKDRTYSNLSFNANVTW